MTTDAPPRAPEPPVEVEADLVPHLFVGGPYDGQVIRVQRGMGVVYAAEEVDEPVPLFGGPLATRTKVWEYAPGTVEVLGRRLPAFLAAGPPDEDGLLRATLRRDVYDLHRESPPIA